MKGDIGVLDGFLGSRRIYRDLEGLGFMISQNMGCTVLGGAIPFWGLYWVPLWLETTTYHITHKTLVSGMYGKTRGIEGL